MAGEGALHGVRVLEVGSWVAVPFAGKLLAEYGAEVIKVEPPAGDRSRRHGPFSGGAPHPERGALHLYLNTNKRSVTLDLTAAGGQRRFRELAATADLVLDGQQPGTMAAWGLAHAALAERNPRLVMLSLTAFGQDGPYAGAPATNLTEFAAGGQMSITGDPDREPLKNAGYQADYQLGLNGFAAATIALVGARASGLGQHVDVSAMECMASVLEASLNTHAYTGRSLGTRRGKVRSAAIALYECADGWLGVHAMPRNLPFLLQLMEMPDLMQDERFATPAARLQNNDELVATYMAWAYGQTRKETYERAGAMRAPVAYAHTLQDLKESPQLAARNYWREIDHPETGRLIYPGPPFSMSDSPARAGRAPLLNEHGSAGWEVEARSAPEPVAAPDELPLSRVRVVDLTMVWAGPYGTRILGDMGAEVLKVEAVNFYDQIRNLGFSAPGTPNVWNRAAYFNHNSRNKYGVTLDLATPAGKELLLDLVKTADVVVENYRAEVMDRLGLGYEALRAVKPDIILISMPGHGKTGPEKDYVAYGTNIEQLCGLVALSGYADRGPQGSGISYGDPMAGTAMAGAVGLALLHRERTGHGQYIEIAQRELMSSVIGEYIVGHSIDGRQPPQIGNGHPYHAPHNVYPTRPNTPEEWGGERIAPGAILPDGSPYPAPPPDSPAPHLEPWVAIACTSDAEFAALCREMGRPELAADPRFADEPSRHANQADLDAIISAWTGPQTKRAVFERLRAAGVPCAPVLSVEEVFRDPHLRARGFFERVTHADAGAWDMEAPLYRLSRTPAHIRLNAPRFGEHTEWALGHLLGLPADALVQLEVDGITGAVPNMAVHQ